MTYYTTDPGAQGLHPLPARPRRLPRPAPGMIPVPKTGATILLHASSADYGGRAQVDHIARLLGADINDDTAQRRPLLGRPHLRPHRLPDRRHHRALHSRSSTR